MEAHFLAYDVLALSIFKEFMSKIHESGLYYQR